MKNIKNWRVVLKKPSAKRMRNNGKIVIQINDPFESRLIEEDISKDQNYHEFSLADSFEYIYNTSVCDGNNFNVWVEYTNDSGSKVEKIVLVPELVSNI